MRAPDSAGYCSCWRRLPKPAHKRLTRMPPPTTSYSLQDIASWSLDFPALRQWTNERIHLHDANRSLTIKSGIRLILDQALMAPSHLRVGEWSESQSTPRTSLAGAKNRCQEF